MSDFFLFTGGLLCHCFGGKIILNSNTQNKFAFGQAVSERKGDSDWPRWMYRLYDANNIFGNGDIQDI